MTHNKDHGKNPIHYHINLVAIIIIHNRTQQMLMAAQIVVQNHRDHHVNDLVALAKKQY